MLKYAENTKYFLNMNISLIMRLTCLKIVRHVLKTHLEGRVSQNFDVCLSFNLIAFRRGDFQKNTKISQKYPFFALK